MSPEATTIVPLVFTRYTDEFTEVDWGIWLNSPFELNNTIQAMMQEAGQKGMAVIVNASLIPSDQLFPPDEELEKEAAKLKLDKKEPKEKK